MSKQFGERTTALEVVEGRDLTGKDVIVTGGASGIGVETARALAKAGARVVLAARDLKRAEEVASDIRKTTGNTKVEIEELELGSLKSIDDFVKRYLAKKRPLHVLINNAGVMNTPQGITDDGFETQFGVNHVGPFALTTGLLPALKAAKGARVVSVASLAHAYGNIDFNDINFTKGRPYEGFVSYGQSKTANVLFAVELTRRYKADGIYSNALMPGFIMTSLQKHTPKEQQAAIGIIDENGNASSFFKTTEQGAATSVWAAVAPELEGRGGLYLDNCKISTEKTQEEILKNAANGYKDGMPAGYLAYAVDPVTAERLWGVTEQMLADARKRINNRGSSCFTSCQKKK